MENNQTNEIFNLNLKTLESLHSTIEEIHRCDKLIASGCDERGTFVYNGDVLKMKHKLVLLLLNWTNVLISEEKVFEELQNEYNNIKLITGRTQTRRNNSMGCFSSSSNYEIKTVYSPEIDNQIDMLVQKICRTLQVKGIFKKKPDNPNFALNN